MSVRNTEDDDVLTSWLIIAKVIISHFSGDRSLKSLPTPSLQGAFTRDNIGGSWERKMDRKFKKDRKKERPKLRVCGQHIRTHSHLAMIRVSHVEHFENRGRHREKEKKRERKKERKRERERERERERGLPFVEQTISRRVASAP